MNLSSDASASPSVLVVRAAELATLVVRGGDRVTWLNGLLTCNLANLGPGQATYGLAVTQKGRVQCDVIVLVDSDRVLLAVPSTVRDELIATFDRYLVMEDAEMSAEDLGVWRVHGPRAVELVDRWKGEGDVRAAALDFTGLGGAVLFASASDAAEFEAGLAAAARELGGAVGDDAAWERLRLERGVPRFGVDFDVSNYPQEAGLEQRAVSFDKGCYLGQEVVCMLEMRGRVKRKLVALDIASGEAPPKGASVSDAAGNVVGEVSSSAERPGGGATALAMLKASAIAAAAPVRVAGIEARIRDGAR